MATGCTQKVTNNSLDTIKADGEIVKALVTNECVDVDKVTYDYEEEIGSYHSDVKDMTVYWDDRYSDSLSDTRCSPNLIGRTTVDTTTNDAAVSFGGSQSTLIYKLHEVYPFRYGNTLMMQIDFNEVKYQNLGGNLGGNIAFNLFLINKITKERINYVISTHALGRGWNKENRHILYDPSTDTHFISTTVDHGNIYTTITSLSSTINNENGFFRVNITQENIKKVLELNVYKNKDVNNWHVPFIGIQFELEESHGDGILSAEFEGFSAYLTTGAM